MRKCEKTQLSWKEGKNQSDNDGILIALDAERERERERERELCICLNNLDIACFISILSRLCSKKRTN